MWASANFVEIFLKPYKSSLFVYEYNICEFWKFHLVKKLLRNVYRILCFLILSKNNWKDYTPFIKLGERTWRYLISIKSDN